MSSMHSSARVFSPRAWKDQHRGNKQRRRRISAGGVFVLLCIVGLFLPSAYVVESPGPTFDVLGKTENKTMIEISGAPSYQSSGKLLMTTVNASGMPSSPALNAEVLWGWINPQQVIMSREVIYPSGETDEEYEQETSEEMSGAQTAATSNALEFLKKKGVETSGISVTMGAGDVGGPSAGLMFTLGTIDKLTPIDETGGKVIAGTGTIEKSGKVGAIGGIRLKMIGAQRDGATWFLAPSSNCDEVVGNVPQGLREVKVHTLQEAYEALVSIGEGKGESLPHCSVEK